MDKEFLKEFKTVEKKLLKLLNQSKIDFDNFGSSASVRNSIKRQIERVEEAKVLLEKYETIARKIQNFDDEDEQTELIKNEEPKIKQMPAKDVERKVVIDNSKKKNKTEIAKQRC